METHRQTQISLFDGLMVKKDGCLLCTYHFVKGGIRVIPLRKIRKQEDKHMELSIFFGLCTIIGTVISIISLVLYISDR